MIRLSHPTAILRGSLNLPASKSISNRLLILRALYAPQWELTGLSGANDTRILQRALDQHQDHYHVGDAGTAMRFLTAYLASRDGEYVLEGSERMHQRPMKELVEALRECGAQIDYLGEDGHAPLRIGGGGLTAGTMDLRQVRSSQFISAMLMILPLLGPDARLRVDPAMHSWSFVRLTLDCMRLLGFEPNVDNGLLSVHGAPSVPSAYPVEVDWTSFYYGFSMAALAKEAELFFPGLSMESLQSERQWLDLLTHPLIQLVQEPRGIRLHRKAGPIRFAVQSMDLFQHPDLAPTFALLFAGLDQHMEYSGLEWLQFKESDRDEAIADHLAQFGVQWQHRDAGWRSRGMAHAPEKVLRCRDDHRMFMAAAPLALRWPLLLDDPSVCAKSYPDFLAQLDALGFILEYDPLDLT